MTKTWIILLRGINVGGKGTLAVKDLRLLLENMGFINVKTYIQSGNCILQTTRQSAAEIENIIANAIEDSFGFKPKVLALGKHEFKQAIDKNPYHQTENDPKSLHVFFLSHKPTNIDTASLDALQSPTEQYTLMDSRLYLYAPDGVGKSKLFANIEKILATPVTARNLRTITKIAEISEQFD